MNVINLFRNNLMRILNQKAIIIVAVIVVPIMIGLAVLFSTKVEMKPQVALVTEYTKNIPQSSEVQVKVMRNKPAFSKLLLAKYAAIVEEKIPGNYVVISIKSKAEKKIIENFFSSGKISSVNKAKATERGPGTNILGFIVMIVLMQGIGITTIYPEDRIHNTFRRVLIAPVTEKLYLLVLGLFTFLCLFIPTFSAIAITKGVFGVKVGFGFGMLAILIGMLSALSTSFALFFSSALKGEIALAATAFYVITSVLAGCFYSFTGSNKVLDKLCNILPQKAYMTLSQGLEDGKSMIQLKEQSIYLLVWIIGLWLLGSLISKRKIEKGIY